jgi:hypothetical protein
LVDTPPSSTLSVLVTTHPPPLFEMLPVKYYLLSVTKSSMLSRQTDSQGFGVEPEPSFLQDFGSEKDLEIRCGFWVFRFHKFNELVIAEMIDRRASRESTLSQSAGGLPRLLVILFEDETN